MTGRADPASFRREARLTVEDEVDVAPRYAIGAVAARIGVRVGTVRRYEAFGLVEARSIEAGIRLYSEADVDRARRARRLVDDLGVNLAGAAAILHLRDQLLALQRELRALQNRT